jgi:hypothetical protein
VSKSTLKNGWGGIARLAALSLFTLLAACGKGEAPPIIECKFEGYIFSIDKNDTYFTRCEQNDKDPYDIVAVSPEKAYRFTITTKNKKFYFRYPSHPIENLRPFNLDKYVVYCGPSKKLPYNCGAMIKDVEVPFYLEWYDFEGKNYDEKIAVVKSAKQYIDKQTRRVFAPSEKNSDRIDVVSQSTSK